MPRQAALKAANRGHTDIKLRVRGTKKVHIFTGEWVQVDKPKGAPAWMVGQDLEAYRQEGWHREVGRSLTPLAVLTPFFASVVFFLSNFH